MEQLEYIGHVVYDGSVGRTPIGIVSEEYDKRSVATIIPAKIKKFVVQIEDKRFYAHNGFDVRGIMRAAFENIKAGKIVQGGSTITQQLVRNLYKDNDGTFLRKMREIIRAIYIEHRFNKQEILDLYFNNIFFGKNLYGIRAASLFYFKKEPQNLSEIQQLQLITILRGPNYYVNHLQQTINRFRNINEILYRNHVISKVRFKQNKRAQIEFHENPLQTIKVAALPYLTTSINNNSKTITTTINSTLQQQINNFISSSKYPLSIICISKKGVLGVGSNYGIDYPFVSRSNVGSTLKPFLYSFLRQQGITREQVFNAKTNNCNINFREATYSKNFITLPEALQLSNNNVFINGCATVGLDQSLDFLSNIFNKPRDNFYLSSILGATKSGLSLYELTQAYYDYFIKVPNNYINNECLNLLNRVLTQKTNLNIENIFLKTGTTNNNKERYAIIGHPDYVFGAMRNENPITDVSKDGSFVSTIIKITKQFFMPKRNYKWN